MRPTLVGMHFSPWTEKARWALDHHGIGYRFEQHVPMLGEPLLRVRARARGRVSVPVLLTAHGVVRESLRIAEHAERIGHGAPLFRDEAAVLAWNEKSEAILAAARPLVLARIAESKEAQKESLPAFVPGVARGAMAATARLAVAYLGSKYADVAGRGDAMARLDAALADLRAALAGKRYLLGDFSYADIAMAVGLQGGKPVADRWIALGPATREAWTKPELATKYADLVAWRDDLYAAHRGTAA